MRPGGDRAPFGFVPLALVAVAFLTLPLIALLVRAPWGSLPGDLTAPGVLTALRLSLICSVGALCLSLVFGVPLAWVLARVDFPGRRLVRALVLLPMVLPPVVGGVALLPRVRSATASSVSTSTSGSASGCRSRPPA